MLSTSSVRLFVSFRASSRAFRPSLAVARTENNSGAEWVEGIYDAYGGTTFAALAVEADESLFWLVKKVNASARVTVPSPSASYGEG